MKSLNEHNNLAFKNHEALRKLNEPHPNGIKCPECEGELWDSNPCRVLCSHPPKLNVHCPKCNYKGYRIK